MKKEIKSFYIIKKIFSYLKEKKKLDLITYNKSMQKLMGYNIDYYMNISGKYKEAEKNGEGKEFYNQSLSYYELWERTFFHSHSEP